MPASARVVGNRWFLDQGLVPDNEWEQTKREVALEIDTQIKMEAANLADEDPQIGFNFKRNWHTQNLPKGVVFGSDYDYWNHVVNDARKLWRTFAGQIAHDFIAESIAGEDPAGPWSVEFYARAPDALQVWDHGKPVGFGVQLHGPWVDVGPTADFSVFLEQWDFHRPGGTQPIRLFWGVGVMHAIARQLQADYAGIHTVYVMPIRPEDRSEIRETPNRKNPVITLPIVRIAPRHYRK